MDAISRDMEAALLAFQALGAPVAEELEHLVSFGLAFGCLVEPYQTSVPFVTGFSRPDEIRTGNDIEKRALPMDAIRACGKRGGVEPAGHVPHLVKSVTVVKPDAVVERSCHRTEAIIHLLVRFRDEDRIPRIIDWVVPDTPEVGAGYQVVVDEQLPSRGEPDGKTDIADIRMAPVRGNRGVPRQSAVCHDISNGVVSGS